ncbi:tRNA1(Val) (adenine(37)-N6)-methyltransferase [Leptolyngbya sp. FACHB-261]|uniref:tRNA1(Val) (adenine(37)-N6)-methyltransferase n=1 Tax=Leptolyngbya sp. FACHB-261 TaxID=2692806 RepID=UPI001685CF53|nr:methyltransferase [Leptolyngbya sp. FACHB-261]MBD2099733.1 methyltransferase [Leptolyngbya sp. FACHB-261]
MPNPYFRFKQFTVTQDRCAMKVGTDGVLLGAWTTTTDAQQILDIGTGTGLVALMLAQRSTAAIDAVELDPEACSQARENVQRSPWRERIQVHSGLVQDYAVTCSKRYELVVSNPPFFENASKTLKQARNIARHNDFLPQADLLQVAKQLLQDEGRLAVIYPPEQAQSFQSKAASFGFFCNRVLCVKPTLEGPIKRILMELSKSKFSYQEDTIAIEAARRLYTTEFISLIRDFYLKY